MVSALFAIVPLYIYPSSGTWSTLTTAATSYPDMEFIAVINPDNGPGSTEEPDSNYISAIANLNTYSNIKPICYVHTTTATRAMADVEADISTCAGWANYTEADIHMDGIFFDEAPSSYTTTTGSYMQSVTTYARDALGSGKDTIVFNPGTTSDSGFYSIADYINAWEDEYSAYSSSSIDTISSSEMSQSTMMIYDFTDDSSTQASIVDAMATAGIAGVFISTTDYSSWSSLWTEFCEALADPSASSSTSSSSSVASSTKATSTKATSTKATSTSAASSKASTTSSMKASTTSSVKATTSSTLKSSSTSKTTSTTSSASTTSTSGSSSSGSSSGSNGPSSNGQSSNNGAPAQDVSMSSNQGRYAKKAGSRK